MSEPILKLLDVPTLVNEETGTGVTKLVKRDLRPPELLHHLFEFMGDIIRIIGCPILLDKDIATLISVGVSEEVLVFFLLFLYSLEALCCCVCEL